MTRIVIHAGFHKTGTSSVQAMLRKNGDRLARHLRVFLKDDFEALTKAARAFSIHRDSARLEKVRARAAEFFAMLDPGDARPVLMSSEDLSGHLPGRHGIGRYDAAPPVMAMLEEVIRTRPGSETELTFVFSTRDPEAWLRSTWWQNLRSTRLTTEFDAYSEEIGTAADMGAVLAEAATALAAAKVVGAPLEHSRDRPEGPLAPLLDLVGLPEGIREKLEILPPVNAEPEIGLSEVFLALNRSGLNDKNLRDAKTLLRKMATKQMTQR